MDLGKPLKEGSDVPSIQSQVIFTTSISAFGRHEQYLLSSQCDYGLLGIETIAIWMAVEE